jgi:hypothetical protein
MLAIRKAEEGVETDALRMAHSARSDSRAYMRPREAAKSLSLSQSTLNKWRAAGPLK